MATQIRFGMLMGMLLLLLGGCDEPEKAQDKCASMVDTYCDRIVSCAQQGELLNASFGASDLRAECESFMREDARCDQAVRTGKSFHQCVDDASHVSCDDVVQVLSDAQSQNDRYLGAIPSSCEDSVLYGDDD